MKKIINVLAAILVITVLATTLTGCRKESAPANSVVIGIVNTSSNRLDFSKENTALTRTLSDSLSISRSKYAVFEIDGAPYKVDTGDVFYSKGISKTNHDTLLKKNINKVYEAFDNAVPRTAECDILSGINCLSQSLSNMAYGTNDKKTMVIITNLLSTTGALSFTENMLYTDLNAYCNFLKNEITNLSDIDIRIFITKPTGNQPQLPVSLQKKLQDFYSKLLMQAGALSVEFIDADLTESTAENPKDYPPVTAIPIRENKFDGTTIDYTIEENMAFLPNSTALVNSSESDKLFKELAAKINSLSSHVAIIGSTASTDSSTEKHLTFSKQRAEAVKRKLIENGANPQKIQGVYGIGKEHNEYRIPDYNEFASEETRAKNRCVYIISVDSEKGQELIKLAEKFPINKN